MKKLEKRSFAWFEKRRRTKALDLAQEQIVKALDTVTLLNRAVQDLTQGNKKEAMQHVKYVFKTEEEVDRLRTQVFKELSKGAALFADYREDLLHLVKRLDTLADHVKDAARCVEMLEGAELPQELIENIAHMTSALVDCASNLRVSMEVIYAASEEVFKSSSKVEEIERGIDEDYLKIKKLFIKYAEEMNVGAIVIFDDLIEFIEQAADMCADTAEYIVTLSSRE
jgi:predicted phosphate transport protein (TIGR00153 family)